VWLAGQFISTTHAVVYSVSLFVLFLLVLRRRHIQARFMSKNVRGAKAGLASLSTLCHIGLKHAVKYSPPVG